MRMRTRMRKRERDEIERAHHRAPVGGLGHNVEVNGGRYGGSSSRRLESVGTDWFWVDGGRGGGDPGLGHAG